MLLTNLLLKILSMISGFLQTKRGDCSPLFFVLLVQKLFNSVRILLLEGIGIPAGIHNGEPALPAKFLERLIAVCKVRVHIARASRKDLIRNLDSIRFFEGMDQL